MGKYHRAIERLIDHHDDMIFEISIILDDLIRRDVIDSQLKLYSK